jgi:mevalonate kinase
MKANNNLIGSGQFYSNGKLLLSGEYFVLKGSKSLALPTSCGQEMEVEALNEPQLIWQSYDNQGNCWLEAVFELPKLRLINATFDAEKDGGQLGVAEKLFEILLVTRKLNPEFLNITSGYSVKTHLTFPRYWGLGTSSTLINNLANWADINPYELLQNTFGGSGYDLACAQYNSPIFYQRRKDEIVVKEIDFDPVFKDQLYFVYLNKKRNSQEAIKEFTTITRSLESEIDAISELSDAFLNCRELPEFERLLSDHEQIVAKTLGVDPIQKSLFADYFGQIKSLGAWGGDFILATGNTATPSYFNQKGFQTVIPYANLIIS